MKWFYIVAVLNPVTLEYRYDGPDRVEFATPGECKATRSKVMEWDKRALQHNISHRDSLEWRYAITHCAPVNSAN